MGGRHSVVVGDAIGWRFRVHLTSAEYCRLASTCLDRAEQTRDRAERRLMHVMAEVFLKFAVAKLDQSEPDYRSLGRFSFLHNFTHSVQR